MTDTVSRYETTIDLTNPNISHTLLIMLAGQDRAVLDVGCAAGDTARALASRGCTVSGVEIDAQAAEPSRDVYEELVIADINHDPLSTHFKAEAFDSIIFGDVLEHVADPAATLLDATSLLAPEGRVLISIPNVAHASVRLALLQGRWDYQDKGILDRTHLHWFTRESVCELLEGAGLVIEELHATVLDPLHPLAADVAIDVDRLPPTIIEWVRHQPDALHFQYIASARRLKEGEVPGPRPRVQPALALETVRQRDRHTQAMAEEQAERHRMLTIRDHIIGQEVALARATALRTQAAARAKAADQRAKRFGKELSALRTALDQVARSRRPRRAARRLAEQLARQSNKGDSQ